MSLLFKLAFLNIWRNKRRSLLTLAAIALSMCAMLFLRSFTNGIVKGVTANWVNYVTGDVRVHGEGFFESLSPAISVQQTDAIETQLKENPKVIAYSPRVRSEAMAGTSQGYQSVNFVGIQPTLEAKTTLVVTTMKSGEFLKDTDTGVVVLGDRLAKILNVTVGDKIVVMLQDRAGQMSGLGFRIQGIYHAGGMVLDKYTVYASLADARQIVGLGPNDVSEVAINLQPHVDRQVFVEEMKRLPMMPGNEVMSFEEMYPEVREWSRWYFDITSIVMYIAALLVMFGVMNTLMMSIFERTKELGVLLAIGTQPYRIVALVLLETLLLSGLGLILGGLGGYVLVEILRQNGVALMGMSDALEYNFMSRHVYPVFRASQMFYIGAVILGVALFGAIFPARRASSLNPVKAIYHS